MNTAFRTRNRYLLPILLTLVAAWIGTRIGSAKESLSPLPSEDTLSNLQAAFDGESNAHARYVAFAKQADADGYTQVASLFRAAARSEEIHAASHAAVIKKMGGTPKANVQKPEVKTTQENLKIALKGESYERDTMYPKFVEQARADANRAAVRTFTFALNAETEHAKLYQQALDNLESWKGGKKDFFVCEVCGMTLTALPEDVCPSCNSPKEKFVKIN
jgi:rubrerythrin